MKIPFLDLGYYYKKNKSQIDHIFNTVLSSGIIMDGPYTQQCEEKIAALYKYPFAVLTSSCTDAIYFALRANGIAPGDEVIISSFSFVASVTPVLRAGATPVFVDVDPKTGLMDISRVEKKITRKTKAIIAVHLYGQLLDMAALSSIAKRYNLVVIEDAAQSIGGHACYTDTAASDCICISFDPTKVVHAMGTGGIALCMDKTVADKIRRLRYHGKQSNDFVETGYNSRISEYQAALILFQLDQLEEIIQERRLLAQHYLESLSNIKGISLPDISANCNVHKFVIQTEKRNEIKEYLAAHGIQTMIHYAKGLHEYTITKSFVSADSEFPNTDLLTRTVLSLPLYGGMSVEAIIYTCNMIQQFVKQL